MQTTINETRAQTISKLYETLRTVALKHMLTFQSDLEYDLTTMHQAQTDVLIWGYRQSGTNMFELIPSCKQAALERITHPQHNTGEMLRMYWYKVDITRGTINAITTNEAIKLFEKLPDPVYTIKTKNVYIKTFSTWPEVYDDFKEIRKIDPDAYIVEEKAKERCTA